MELNGIYQLLVYANNDKLLCGNINTIKKDTGTIDTRKKTVLEANAEKAKYMFMSHHKTPEQNLNIQIANKCSTDVAKFKYLGMTGMNQNYIHERIWSRSNSGNTSYHSVLNLLPSCLLSKNVNIIIYKTIILPATLCGC
jgi:hypothetical protein